MARFAQCHWDPSSHQLAAAPEFSPPLHVLHLPPPATLWRRDPNLYPEKNQKGDTIPTHKIIERTFFFFLILNPFPGREILMLHFVWYSLSLREPANPLMTVMGFLGSVQN